MVVLKLTGLFGVSTFSSVHFSVEGLVTGPIGEAQGLRLWIKHPLAILAENSANGIVVEDGRIIECVPQGNAPEKEPDSVFDASDHVVIPGLINTHHHFFQTMTRAHPAALNKELFPWLQALYPIWTQHVRPDNFRLATRLALTELLMSGCTTASDHHYLYPEGIEDAMDIQAEEAAKLGMRITLTPWVDGCECEGWGNATGWRCAG